PMYGWVRGILELLRYKVAGMLANEFLSREDGARHSLDGGREMELGAEAGKQSLALDAHVFGHRQDQAVALHGGDHREADPGVAARRLHDRAATLHRARALGILDQRQRDAR